jgi:hypothetical protein
MWMGLCVVLATIVVQMTRSGIDILALLMAGFTLLLLERTLGDWVAESVGPAPTALIFALVAGMCVAYVTTDRGKSRVGRLLAAAETRGYKAAYFHKPSEPDKTSADDVRQTAVTPVSTAGSRPRPPSRTASGEEAATVATSPSPTPIPAAQPAAAKGVRLTRLTISPEVSTTGQPITIRASLSYDEAGVLPRITFSVDGRVIDTIAPDTRGMAQVPWKTRVPGQYVVRAELAGGLAGAYTLSAVVNVLPGR